MSPTPDLVMLSFSIHLRRVVYNMVAKEKKKKEDKDWRGDLLYLGKLIFWIGSLFFYFIRY